MVAAFLLTAWTANAQTTVLSYQQTNTATASAYLSDGLEMTVSYLSTCQQSVSATFNSIGYGNGTWSQDSFDYYVNGNLIGNATGLQTIDLSSYIPVNSIRFVKAGVSNWNEIHMTVLVATTDGSAPPAPSAPNVSYCQNAAASPLIANLGESGAGLKWYLSEVGSGFSTTAPTPATTDLGTVSYWVSQANASGCESERSQIDVTVVANPDSAISREENVLSVAQNNATYQWGFCENGNFTAIAGATTQNFTATETGSYAVEVSLGSCSETSDCFEVSSLSVANFATPVITLYPNPTNGLLNIDLGQIATAKATLIDVNGRELSKYKLNATLSLIDISSLASGIYLIRIESANATETRRIVKK